MNKRRKIIVINLGWEQEPLLDRLLEYDLEIYGIHYDENYYKHLPYRDILITNLRNLEEIIKFAKEIKPDAVISDQCDYSYYAQSLIAEQFNLPGPRIKEAQIATNKYLQRLKYKGKAGCSPTFKLCLSIDDVYQFTKMIDFPLIIKPVDNRGSFGVNKIEKEEEIKFAYYDALINSHSRFVLVEKFIKGTHITIDGYVFYGKGPKSLALATKTKLKDKGEIIDGEIVYPGNFSPGLYRKCMLVAEEVATKMGFSFGFFHGEFIVTKEENVFLTEIANRGGGVYTSEIILPNITGIDIIKIYINDVLGEKIIQDIKAVNQKPTIMKLFSFANLTNGVVKSIKGIETLEKDPHVLKVKMFLKKGDLVSSIKSGADRHGVIILTSKNKEILYKKLKYAISSLVVELE